MTTLDLRRNHLEDLLNRRVFDYAAWVILADQFEAVGRLSGAAAIRRKAEHYKYKRITARVSIGSRMSIRR